MGPMGLPPCSEFCIHLKEVFPHSKLFVKFEPADNKSMNHADQSVNKIDNSVKYSVKKQSEKLFKPADGMLHEWTTKG